MVDGVAGEAHHRVDVEHGAHAAEAGTGQKAEGGWARMMNSGLTKEHIAAMPLDKLLGERGRNDPSEWM